MPLISVGTTSVLLLNPNPSRRRLAIQFQPQQADANNTGKVYIGYGFQPIATPGHPSQGEILIQSAAIDQPGAQVALDEKYKGAIWALADTASQSLIVEEE